MRREIHNTAVILVLTLLGAAAPAQAFVSLPGIDTLLSESDVCVVARVVRVEDVSDEQREQADTFYLKVATVEWTSVVTGDAPHAKRLRVYFGGSEQDDSDYRVGARYLAFLKAMPTGPNDYEHAWLHWSAIRVEGDGAIVLPDRYDDPAPPDTKLDDLITEILYVKGPTLEVVDCPRQLDCDEPIRVTWKMTNPSPRPMVIALERGGGPAGFGFFVFGLRGLELGPVPGYARQAVNDASILTRVTLDPGESITRTMDIAPRHHHESLFAHGAIRSMRLYWDLHIAFAKPPTDVYHRGTVAAPVPVTFRCRHPSLDQRKANVTPRGAVVMKLFSKQATFAPGERVEVGLEFLHAGPPDDRYEPTPLTDRQASIISALIEVTRDGRPVAARRESLPGDPLHALGFEHGADNALGRALTESWATSRRSLRLDQLFDLTKSGEYAARVALPVTSAPATQDAEPMRSNTIRFVVGPRE